MISNYYFTRYLFLKNVHVLSTEKLAIDSVLRTATSRSICVYCTLRTIRNINILYFLQLSFYVILEQSRYFRLSATLTESKIVSSTSQWQVKNQLAVLLAITLSIYFRNLDGKSNLIKGLSSSMPIVTASWYQDRRKLKEIRSLGFELLS